MEEKKNIKNEKNPLSVGHWLVTFTCMNIPIIGWIYLLILSRSKTQPLKKEFAKAYLLYKLLLLIICIVLLIIAASIVIPIIQDVLAYMENL